MKIFAWHTDVIQGYRSGTVAVAATDAGEARMAILADFDRWIRTGFGSGSEHSECSPLAGTFDGLPAGQEFPDYFDDAWKAETLEEIEKHRLQLARDITGDPIDLPSGILYMWGGD